MNNLTSQATWEGLGVPLPKDFQIQSPLYREIDKLNRANNDAFMVVLALGFILCIALIYNAQQTREFEFYGQSRDPTI
jgi:hypothetical protein